MRRKFTFIRTSILLMLLAGTGGITACSTRLPTPQCPPGIKAYPEIRTVEVALDTGSMNDRIPELSWTYLKKRKK